MEHLETSPDPLPADAPSPEAGQSPTSLLAHDSALVAFLSKSDPMACCEPDGRGDGPDALPDSPAPSPEEAQSPTSLLKDDFAIQAVLAKTDPGACCEPDGQGDGPDALPDSPTPPSLRPLMRTYILWAESALNLP